MPCQRVPPAFMHDHGFRARPGAAQAIDVLMVVERVAAGPVDQPDIGIGPALAVEIVGSAGVEQHVGDARDRNEVADRILALRQRRPAYLRGGESDAVDRSVAEAEAAARQADLAEHGGERDRHPVGLLAMLGALQRPGHHDHGPRRRHAPRELLDPSRVDTGDRCGPGGILRGAVRFARHIGREAVVAGGVAVEEFAIDEAVADQRMRNAEHQRDVGIGPQSDPFGLGIAHGVVADRADRDELRARRLRGVQRLPEDMARYAAGTHLRILLRQPAEHDDQPGMGGDHRQARVLRDEAALVADDMRKDRVGGGVAVVLHRADIAADRIQETVDLALRVMKASSARPAVGPAIDRAIAARLPHPCEFRRRDVERFVPVDLDEGLGTASRASCRMPLLQKRPPHRGPQDTARAVQRVDHSVGDRRGVGIDVDRRQPCQPAVLEPGLVGAPVRGHEMGGRVWQHVSSPWVSG